VFSKIEQEKLEIQDLSTTPYIQPQIYKCLDGKRQEVDKMSVKEEILEILINEFGLSSIQRCENVSKKVSELFLKRLSEKISSLKIFIKNEINSVR